MFSRFIFLAPALLLGAPAAFADDDMPAPAPSSSIIAVYEAGPGPAPDASATGLSFEDEVEGFLQTEATKPDNTTTKGTVFDETDLYGHLNWSNWLTVNGSLKYEHQRFNNIDDFYPDRSAFMRSEGLSLRQLYVTVRPLEDSDDISLYGGKIHPQFGTRLGL